MARSYRRGDWTAVWVPDAAHEALRDLVRTREDAKQDQTRARLRLGKFLLRHGKRPEGTMKCWTGKYREWLKGQVHFDQPALEATFLDYVHQVSHQPERLTDLEKAIDAAIAAAPAQIRAVVEAVHVAKITAVTIVAEVGAFSRLANPRLLMGYSGMVASEFSSGNRIQRGGITQTGNAHRRRVIGEAAWAYQRRPWVGGFLRQRQEGLEQEVRDIAWKAQQRLHSRYANLTAPGKNKNQVVTAVGRKLLGFLWAMATCTEAKYQKQAA